MTVGTTQYPNFSVYGPAGLKPRGTVIDTSLWCADLRFRREDDRTSARNVFLRRDAADRRVFPGTVDVEAQPQQACLTIFDQRFRFSLANTDDVQLSLQFPHETWTIAFPDLLQRVPFGACVTGTIPIRDSETGGGAGWRNQFPHVADAKSLTLHAGGFSFEGRPKLPWLPDDQVDDKTWVAPLIVTVPRPVVDPTELLLSLDFDLLESGGFPEARNHYRQAFATLRDLLKTETQWGRLELTDDIDIPRFHWRLASGPNASPPLHIDSGAGLVTLADRRPAPQNTTEEAPRSVLTLDPPLTVDRNDSTGDLEVRFDVTRMIGVPIGDSVTAASLDSLPTELAGRITLADGLLRWSGRVTADDLTAVRRWRGGLELGTDAEVAAEALVDRLQLRLNQSDAAAVPTLTWSFDAAAANAESLKWANLSMVYDPIEVADQLRTDQGIQRPDPDEVPRPGHSSRRIEPAVLWGMTPLHDGWATLPFLNLTEEIAANILPAPETDPRVPLASGAAVIGNDDDRLWNEPDAEDEHRWNLTLFDAERITGEWIFGNDGQPAEAKFSAKSASVRFVNPDAAASGLLWLSTDRPKMRDALPESDAWPSALRRIPLRTMSPALPFPSPWQLTLQDGEATRGQLAGMALLKSLTLQYRRNRARRRDTKTTPRTAEFRRRFNADNGNGNASGVPSIGVNHPLHGTLDFSHDGGTFFVMTWRGRALQPSQRAIIEGWTQDRDVHPEARGVLGELLHHIDNSPGTVEIYQMYVDDEFYVHSPQRDMPLLVWKRHRTLPTVQALPLTQSLRPANYPASGRQLAPLQWPAIESPEDNAIENEPEWTLAHLGGNAAKSWPQAIGVEEPADDWFRKPADEKGIRDADRDQAMSLPMVSLSVSGLSLHPQKKGTTFTSPLAEGFTSEANASNRVALGLQYAFGLPILNEVFAFASTAALPDERPPTTIVQTTSASADSVAADIDVVLTPETFADHWRRLGEQGLLATSDREYAFVPTDTANSTADVQSLIEPFHWDIVGSPALSAYPGSLTLTDGTDASEALTLGRDTALRGFDGWFDVDSSRKLRLKTGTGQFRIIAGTMNAVEEPLDSDTNAAVGLRDQRGLVRGHTGAAVGNLLRTPVVLKAENSGSDERAELCTLTAPMTLTTGAETWDFWFSSLPTIRHDDTERFLRVTSHVSGPGAHAENIEDVNDTAADSRRHAHLTGYEWRLFPHSPVGAGAVTDGAHPAFRLGLLDFYPLTLERVEFDNVGVVELRMHGRLQLPIAEGGENTESANTVAVTFERPTGDDNAAGDVLQLKTVELLTDENRDDQPICWPLSTHPGSPQLVAEALHWDAVRKAIVVSQAHLHTTPWNLDWCPDIDTGGIEPATGPLVFAAAHLDTLQRSIDGPAESSKDERDVVRVTSAELRLFRENANTAPSASAAKHHLWLAIAGRWGSRNAARLIAEKSLSLTGNRPGDPTRVTLQARSTGNGQRELEVIDEAASADDLAKASLQVAFGRIKAEERTTFLLPAMKIGNETVRGYAAMSFTPRLDEQAQLRFHRCGGTAELVADCDWGESLQAFEQEEPQSADAQQKNAERLHAAVFGSSSGNISAGLLIRANVKEGTNGSPRGTAFETSLLLNGLLEVNNLVSWPDQPEDQMPERFHFPKVDGATDFSHLRHTARVLLNQVSINDGESLQPGTGNVLFTLGLNVSVADQSQHHISQAFQFPAVVEHQIAAIRFVPNDDPPLEIGPQWRWTVTQEVRLSRPRLYSRFLNDLRAARTTELETHHGNHSHFEPLDEVAMGVLQKSTRDALAGESTKDDGELKQYESVETKDGEFQPVDRLIVDLSVAVCLLAESGRLRDGDRGAVPLQFLPGSVIRAKLALRNDFASRDPQTERWVQITLPFLGRLQDAAHDSPLADNGKAPKSLLQVDPVLRLTRAFTGESFLLNLTSRLRAIDSVKHIEAFDTVTRREPAAKADWQPGRAWSRLDPTTLDQSWYRLQEPPREAGANSGGATAAPVSSVLAALPQDSPARQSRQTALTALFDPQRATWPPNSAGRTEVDLGHQLQWRYGALLTFRSRFVHDETVPAEFKLLAFWPAGHRINGLRRNVDLQEGVQRLVAVNLLPPDLSESATPPLVHPVSFTVSPYQALSQTEVQPQASVALDDASAVYNEATAIFADVIALDEHGRQATVVMSRLWQQTVLPGISSQQTALRPQTAMPNRDDVEAWAARTLRSLAEDSRVGVVRVRLVLPATATASRGTARSGGLELSTDAQDVRTAFDFIPLTSALPAYLTAQRAAPLRANPTRLHFADGHRRLTAPPAVAGDSSLGFDPLQVANVQPVYLPDLFDAGDKDRQPHNDYSGTRFDLRSTAGSGLSEVPQPSTTATATDGVNRVASLWWHGSRHAVRFTQPDSSGSATLLPKLFRAPVIRSLLTSVVDLRWPERLPEDRTESGDDSPTAAAWQAVLAGNWSWTTIGNRPGAFFGYQHALSRQRFQTGPEPGGLAEVQSTIVPVQHRATRPVALPPNVADQQKTALAPWGRWFAPTTSVDARALPHDNIRLLTDAGATGLVAALQPFQNTASAVFGLPDTWVTGRKPDRNIEIRFVREAEAGAKQWDFTTFDNANAAPTVQLVIGDTVVRFGRPTLPSGVTSATDDVTLTFRPENDAAAVAALAGTAAGTLLRFELSVPIPDDLFLYRSKPITNVRYAMELTTRFVSTRSIPLPLKPHWCGFEDPHFNRQLATTSARAEAGGTVFKAGGNTEEIAFQVLLAADRQDYNVETPLFLMYTTDLGDERFSPTYKDTELNPTVTVKIRRDSSSETLTGPVLKPRRLLLLQDAMPDYASRIQPGDEVTISLEFPNCPVGHVGSLEPTCVVAKPKPEVTIRIVQRNVAPPPSASYGLLRSDADDCSVVECRRFAWSPEPERIELVNPADLLTGTVRRRAVYRWEDVSRTQTSNDVSFAVQKITIAGSTCVPDLTLTPT